MYQRQIICLDCGGRMGPAVSALSDAGWVVQQVTSSADAGAEIRESSASVAVAVFGRVVPAASECHALEDLLEDTSRVAWVALVEPGALAHPLMRHLIAGYCHDYLTAPFQTQQLLHAVGHAHGMALMDARAPIEGARKAAKEMLGESKRMQDIARILRKCARSRAPVTITGESGTGKELAARAIHRQSGDASGPFVAVNCGAIPGDLIQAELFGHTKGAFTGADREKIGRIEAARAGTLFLDEIGDLSLPLQVNLLRFLQEGVIEKVGSHQSIHVDTRVIAATHKDLEAAVKRGEFREDLYYRLNVLWVELPPLRERIGDIELLARTYLDRFSRLHESRVMGFSKQALNAINSHDWPGNIRELVNRIQRAVVMSDHRLITPADLDLDRRSVNRGPHTLAQVRATAEKEALQRSLRYSGNNIAETARTLGVSRLTVYRLMEKHGLQHNAPGMP